MNQIYTIIGEGNDGIIISPSINNDFDKISKIGVKAGIEYDKLISLPLFLSGYLYLNPEEYEYRELTLNEYKQITNKRIKGIIGCLTMKKIDGISLFEYIESTYSTIESWTNLDHERYEQNFTLMSLLEFKEIYSRIKIFKSLCEMMNNAGYYHNDICSNNIIFTSDKRLYLIDFYTMTVGSPLKLSYLTIQKDDNDSINTVISELIDVGLFNPEIYEYCVKNSIINPFMITYEPYISNENYKKVAMQIIRKTKISLEDLTI